MLVIGHNPTIALLAGILDDGQGELEGVGSVVVDFPTSAVAIFSYDGQWRDLAAGSARLVGYYVGRGPT